MDYKGYLTKESLFFEKWPKYVHWKTGKIHGSIRQSATTTRRYAHSKPNKAQLPKIKGKEVRDMMKAPEGDWYLWALDIDSQELKLQADESKDANFLSCFIGDNKKDVHALTGFQVALKQGVNFVSYEKFVEANEKKEKVGFYTEPEKKVNIPETDSDYPHLLEKQKGKRFEPGPFRFRGKQVNFATSYLCRAKKLAEMVCETEAEAEKFIEAKAAAFPGLMPAILKYIAKCKKRGYAKTMLGARRHLAGHRHFGSNNNREKNAAERLAWSFRIQGSGAEQIKLATGRMYKRGIFHDFKCMPITVIHDEVVGTIHKSVLKERMPKMYACICEKYADMTIETSSTPEIGKNFGSLKPYQMEN